MSEIRTVVDHLSINYSGLLSFKELYRTIREWFGNKGYIFVELQNTENVMEAGKEIYINLEPFNKITDYAKLVIRVQIKATELIDVLVTVDGTKKRMNKAKIGVVLDGYLVTDYENKWESKPMMIFLRTIYDKFLFKARTEEYNERVKADVENLRGNIKSSLNLYKYQ